MSNDSIGVVTLSRHRHAVLRRAMASVFAQDYSGDVEHVIVVDDDPGTVAVAEQAPTRAGLRVTPHLVRRPEHEADEPPGDRRRVYPRIARLFNTGARVSSADWIAFLDDDNEFQPNHLSSLMDQARATGSPAVHSCRSMHWADGSPYLDELWHTVADPAEAGRIFQLMCHRGVRVRHTNLMMDRADPVKPAAFFHPSSVFQADDPVLLVDQSSWLIRRELLMELPVPESYTEQEHQANMAPDDKLLAVLLNAGIPVVSTGMPTVKYYLGGISNQYAPV